MTPSAPEFVPIRLENFAPSFIAQDPFQAGFVIGSDSGVLAFTDQDGNETQERFPVSQSGEAINGVAGFGDFLAVSTGDEVTIVNIRPTGNGPVRAKVIEHGAHGVVGVGDKRFVAPIGHEGILVATPTLEAIATNCGSLLGDYPNFDMVTPEPAMNFYQLCPIPVPYNGRHYLVAACRSAGIRVIDMSITSPEIGMSGGAFADVIDAAYIGNGAYPYAVAAIGISGEVFLCRDIVRQEPPVTLHYQNFAGKVYRILAGHGHIFVLTSKAIHVLGNLASRLVQPVFDESQHFFMTIPMNAVDAEIVYDKWLVIVMADSIHRYDLGEIDQKIDEFVSNGFVPHPGLHLLPFPAQLEKQVWIPRELSHVG